MTDTRKTSKVLEVFEALIEHGFDGASVGHLEAVTGFSSHSVRRAILVLDRYGWVVETPQSNSKARLWMPGEKLVNTAHKHRLFMLEEVNRIKREYRNVAGEELM